MAVPTTITDLSDTASSNFPQDTDSTGSTVASLPRNHGAIIKKLVIRGSDIAVSASGSVTIPTENAYFVVTGTGHTISGFSDCFNGRIVTLKFSGALTLTNSASFIMPTGANITTADGDIASFVNESSGVWRCFNYHDAAVNDAISTLLGQSNTFTAEQIISGATPSLKLNDTGGDDFWVYVDGDSFYILTDRDDSGSAEDPKPLQLDNTAAKAYVYGEEVALSSNVPGPQTQTTWNTGTDTTESTITAAKLTAKIANDLNVSGSAPMYACRAWVNFNGNTGSVRASGNVSSVTRNGAGDYTINFTTAMPDANYSVVCTGSQGDAGTGCTSIGIYGTTGGQTANQAYLSTTSCRILQQFSDGTNLDSDSIHFQVYR